MRPSRISLLPVFVHFFSVIASGPFLIASALQQKEGKKKRPNQPSIHPTKLEEEKWIFPSFSLSGGKEGEEGGFKSIYGEKTLHAARPSKHTHSTNATQTLLFRSSSPRSQSEGISKFPRGEETVFRGKTGNRLKHKGWMEVHKSLL